MLIKLRTFAMAATCTVAVCACAACSPPPRGPETGNRIDFTPLSPDVASPYSGGLTTPSYRIVRSPEEWAALWRELEPRTSREQGQLLPNPVPQIDFGQHAVIVAAMGSRRTGGYSIEVSSLQESADRIVATVMEQTPGTNCLTTQAVTYPIAIVVVPQTGKQLDFEVVRKTQDCN